MVNKYLGMPDIPVSANEEDCLNMEKYVKGLVRFVSECYTPMSIALQGDWGTGKTSFINRMQGMLDQSTNKEIVTIYFNTWQYSQFNMADSLYYSFVQCIVNCIKEKKPIPSSLRENVLQSVLNVTMDIGKQVLESHTGVDLKVLSDEISRHGREKMENIEKLKADYSKLIDETAGNNGRVVIFIDDLDRLNPDTAVALLETIKLFMDVKNCVFVLAIDYDVVVRGIRAKYGSDMDDIKCKSFFDKIIQLPFRMPTERYQIKNMLEGGNLKGQFDGYTDILGIFIENTLGANPRTFKRLINSYELLKIVEERDSNPYESALLLISLIFQTYAYKLYIEFLEKAVDDEDSFKKFREQKEDELQPLFEAIDDVMDKSKKDKQVIFDFQEQMNTSAITSVATTPSNRNTATKVTMISVLEKDEDVNTAAEALQKTVEIVLNAYKDKIDTIVSQNKGSFTTDESKNTSKFRVKKELKIDGYKETLYLGVSSGYGDKVKLVKKMIKIIGDIDDKVIWYDGTKKLF